MVETAPDTDITPRIADLKDMDGWSIQVAVLTEMLGLSRSTYNSLVQAGIIDRGGGKWPLLVPAVGKYVSHLRRTEGLAQANLERLQAQTEYYRQRQVNEALKRPPASGPHGGASGLCAVAEPRDGPAGGELAPGVPAGHFRRLPPARRLHIDNGGPGRCERLRGADPERMPRNAALDPGIRRTARDDAPERAVRYALAPHNRAAPHAPEHRPRPVAGRI